MENFLPLVSVCIPVYNGEKFIREALQSVLDQDYQNIEIVISDDESSDKSLKLIYDFIPKFRCNVRVFNHQRSGLANHLNDCIEKASGKYIKFVFQDDIIYPNCISEMVCLAESQPEVGFVFSKRDILCSSDSFQIQKYAKGIEDLTGHLSLSEGVSAGANLLRDSQLDKNINPIGEPTNVLINRKAILSLNGFSTHYSQLVDVEMWFRLAASFYVGFLPKSLSAFRVHQEQLTYLNNKNNKSQDESRNFSILLLSPPYRDLIDKEVARRLRVRLKLNTFRDFRRRIKNYFKDTLNKLFNNH
jgi:glycosyltransferase involved in cell wall biosynthesis